MNTILAVLAILMIGVLIDVAFLIHKELQDTESYHTKVEKINQLHNENLETTRGAHEDE